MLSINQVMTNEHELHREEIEQAVHSAIEEWRSKLWEIKFKGTAIGKVGIIGLFESSVISEILIPISYHIMHNSRQCDFFFIHFVEQTVVSRSV
jgi:hypothetical protein